MFVIDSMISSVHQTAFDRLSMEYTYSWYSNSENSQTISGPEIVQDEVPILSAPAFQAVLVPVATRIQPKLLPWWVKDFVGSYYRTIEFSPLMAVL